MGGDLIIIYVMKEEEKREMGQIECEQQMVWKEEGEMLRQAREELGLSRLEMANELGVSLERIENLEEGNRDGDWCLLFHAYTIRLDYQEVLVDNLRLRDALMSSE